MSSEKNFKAKNVQFLASQQTNSGLWPAWVACARSQLHLRFLHVNMFVYHRICLDYKNGLRSRGSFFRSQSIQKESKITLRTQIMFNVENSEPGRNPVSYRKPRLQVKVKNSSELKRYVSQNISSNSWNSSVFWLNLYSARPCCIFLLINCFSY